MMQNYGLINYLAIRNRGDAYFFIGGSVFYKILLADETQGCIITSFLYPTSDFDFTDFYYKLKAQEFVIYPGKISDADIFRIGNIGDVYPSDIERLIEVVGKTM